MTKEQISHLLGCKSVSEFMTMYFGLGYRDKLSIFPEEVSLEKGTILYRIRKADSFKEHNPMDEDQWEPTPKEYAQLGRFNRKGESVLYVASSTDYLEQEVHLKPGEEYYLATYECKNSFSVGSFLCKDENPVNMLIHRVALSFNSGDDCTSEDIIRIDEWHNNQKYNTMHDYLLDFLLPFYLYKEVDDVYDITNKLGKIILQKNDNGIRYASAYLPIEFSGFPVPITFDGAEYGNYVLTGKGFEKIKLVSVDKKTCFKGWNIGDLIDILSAETI